LAAGPATSRLPGFGFLLISALSWGVSWPVMKLLMRDWPPFLFRLLAGVGAVTLLLAIAWAQGDALLPRREAGRRRWGRLCIAALFNVTSWIAIAPLSLFWLDASEAAIIAYTMPVWATILAWPALGERPGWQRLAGLALGLSGVTLLMAGPLVSQPVGVLLDKLPGVGFILLTALLFACGTVFNKRYPLAIAPVPAVAWQLVIGMAPVALVAPWFERLDFAAVSAAGWACLLYHMLLSQCAAYLAWFQALRRLPAGTAAIGSLLTPVIGVVSSSLLLDEPLGPRQLAALALTLAGVALASRG
jgi:drug/metabolite transporter (DMT)-like permease